ncbi:GNAT family N-acetyltransferase [soil metagenome]
MSADIDSGRPAIRTGPAGRYTVTRSSAEETVALRRAVLRPHLTVEQMVVSGDQSPVTAYLAARSSQCDQAVLGCLRLEPVACPWPEALEAPAQASWQLRAMATDPSARGTGVGRLLVEAAAEHVASHGGDLIWCNARVSAEQFYSRLGFGPVTGYFVVPEVAEEHIGMVLRVLP